MSTTALSTSVESPLDIYMDPDRFEHLQRVAGLFVGSMLVPEHLKLPDVVIGLQIAHRTRQDALTVLQSMHAVKGKPGWAATYLIARANTSGTFAGPLDWVVEGSGDELEVECFGLLAGSERRVAARVSMAMAKAEGWTSNAKYRSMPEQMLRYRSATFLVRLYCPEILLGLPVADEVEDVQAAEAAPPRPHVIEAQPQQPQRGMAGLAAALDAAPTTADMATSDEVHNADRAAADATAIRQILEAATYMATERDLRNAFYQSQGLTRCSDARWADALQMAVASRYATPDGDGYRSPVVPSQGPAPSAERWGKVRTPGSWSGPVGDDLTTQLAQVIEALSTYDGGAERIARAHSRAECPQIDGASVPALRRLSIALEDEIEDAGLTGGDGV